LVFCSFNICQIHVVTNYCFMLLKAGILRPILLCNSKLWKISSAITRSSETHTCPIFISLFWKHETGQCQKIQKKNSVWTIKRVPRVRKAETALTTAHITKKVVWYNKTANMNNRYWIIKLKSKNLEKIRVININNLIAVLLHECYFTVVIDCIVFHASHFCHILYLQSDNCLLKKQKRFDVIWSSTLHSITMAGLVGLSLGDLSATWASQWIVYSSVVFTFVYFCELKYRFWRFTFEYLTEVYIFCCVTCAG